MVLTQDLKMATATLLWPYLSLKRRPKPHELLLCHSKSSTEQMQLLLLRWAHASEGFYGLLMPETCSFAAQQMVVQAAAGSKRGGSEMLEYMHVYIYITYVYLVFSVIINTEHIYIYIVEDNLAHISYACLIPMS